MKTIELPTETIDRVLWLVQDSSAPMNPSTVAKRIGIKTHQARQALEALETLELISGFGNGAWRKWEAR